MSTTPTTPQWAIEAAKEMLVCVGNGPFTKSDWDYAAAILAKHAPSISPPTDEAKLREVIAKALRQSHRAFDDLEDRTDRILTALAPHLAQREPGDSELLKECRELRVMLYATSTGMRGYHDDGELQDNREPPFIDFKRDSVAEIQRKNLERNVRHLSGQRGEGKP